MFSLSINIVNISSNELPAYATEGAAGMDIRANLEKTITLHSLERAIIATGLFIEIPTGYEAQIRPRSGLAGKFGITCLNSPGTIDSDYRGEIKVILVNLSKDSFAIHHGERIAQLIISKVEQASFIEVAQLISTKRGEGGFGHTGTH